MTPSKQYLIEIAAINNVPNQTTGEGSKPTILAMQASRDAGKTVSKQGFMKRTRKERDADFERLRSQVDGDDRFMRSHRVKKIRTALPRSVPDWTQSDRSVRHFLLHTFPVLRGPFWLLRIAVMPKRQRDRARRQLERAAICYEVLYMFYRCAQTEGEIAEALKDMYKLGTRQRAIYAVRDVLKTIKSHQP